MAKKQKVEFTILQAFGMVLGVGIGMFTFAYFTHLFGLPGVIGGMIGIAIYAFANLKKKPS